MPPEMVMMQMVTSYWVAQSIYASAKLNLADELQTGPKHYEHLATQTATHAPSLYRLLRALASVGIFVETNPGYFALTPLANCLQSNVPNSIKDMAIMVGDPEHYNSWGNILHSIRTGQSSFENLYGVNVFEYYGQNPDPAAIFDRAMTSASNVETAAVQAEFDFSGIKTLVDVAGGHGSLLLAILESHPEMQGILFDQADVIERAKSLMAGDDTNERAKKQCQLVPGNFFESVPQGADAYLLKHILHDWDDERAIAILQKCRQAMAANGRVLVVEQVLPPGNEPFMGKLLDINMLVMCPGGKERTEAEYRALFEVAGFRLTRVVPTTAFISVLEGLPF